MNIDNEELLLDISEHYPCNNQAALWIISLVSETSVMLASPKEMDSRIFVIIV